MIDESRLIFCSILKCGLPLEFLRRASFGSARFVYFVCLIRIRSGGRHELPFHHRLIVVHHHHHRHHQHTTSLFFADQTRSGMPPKTHGPATPGQDTPARTASTISIGRPPSQYESSPLMGSKSSSAARYTSGGRRASANASGPSGSTVKAESVNGADDECYDDIDDADALELPAPQRRRQSLRSIVKQRSKYYIPVLDWLAHYDIKLLGGDITAGVTLACLIIPQSMSYASSLAHLTPVAGLWSVAIPGLVYAMLGTCRQLSDGPEAALSLLVGQMVNEVVNGDPHAIPKDAEKVAIQVACVITLQVGVFTFLLGILRLGFLDVVLSRALLRGFITAIGVIIFIEQLLPMLGLSALLHGASSMHPIEKLFFVIEHVSKTNMHTATLSAVALSILIGMRIIKQRVGGWVRYIPEIFLVVVASTGELRECLALRHVYLNSQGFWTVITAMFRLDGHGVDVLGKLQGGIGLPFGMPFRTEYLRHFRRTVSASGPSETSASLMLVCPASDSSCDCRRVSLYCVCSPRSVAHFLPRLVEATSTRSSPRKKTLRNSDTQSRQTENWLHSAQGISLPRS